VVVLGTTSTIATFANSLWIFFVPLYFLTLGLSPLVIGLVYSLSLLVSALVQIPVGIFIDRFGRKTGVVAGGVTGALAVGVLAISSNATTSVAAYIFYVSVAQMLAALARQALIIESVAEDKVATSYGAFKTMAGWAAIAAPLIGGLYFQSEKFVFLIGSLLVLVAALCRLAFLKETAGFKTKDRKSLDGTAQTQSEGSKSAEKEPQRRIAVLKRNLMTVVSSRLLLALSLAYAFYNLFISNQSFSFLVSLYSKDILRLPTFDIALMFSLWLLIDSQLAIPFGKLADRVGRGKVIIISWVGELVWMMIFAYSFGVLFSLTAFSLWVGFGSLDGPALIGLLGEVTKTETRGVSLGFFTTLSTIVLIPGTALTGFLYSVSPVYPFLANLAIGVFSLFFFVFAFKPAQIRVNRNSKQD
jgi:DHA1 family multidrug resistance protein-like MFS transporter